MSTPTTPAIPTRRFDLVSTPMWQVGALAGLVAAVAVTTVVATAKAVGVPMVAATMTDEGGQEIPLVYFPTGVLVASAIGTAVAVRCVAKASRPRARFLAITIGLTILSGVGPIVAERATPATRLVLELTHVLAAAIVIPLLAWSLARVPSRCT